MSIKIANMPISKCTFTEPKKLIDNFYIIECTQHKGEKLVIKEISEEEVFLYIEELPIFIIRDKIYRLEYTYELFLTIVN